jgi:hypothetical protein
MWWKGNRVKISSFGYGKSAFHTWRYLENMLTDGGVVEDDEKRRIVFPLNFETSTGGFPFRECRVDVFSPELLGKTRQR